MPGSPNERPTPSSSWSGCAAQSRAGRISDAFADAFKSLLNNTDTTRNQLHQWPRIITPIKRLNKSVLIPDDVLASVAVPHLFLWRADNPMGRSGRREPFCAQVPRSTLGVIPGGYAISVDEPLNVADSMWHVLTTAI